MKRSPRGLGSFDTVRLRGSKQFFQFTLRYHNVSPRQIIPYCRHLPSNFIRQLAQLLAETCGLFLASMHESILKQGVKSLDRPYRIVSLRHRHSLYSTIFTPPMGSVPLASLQKSILMTMVQLAIAQLYRPQFVQALTAQIREATIVLSFPFSILAASLRLILNSPQFLHVRLVRKPRLFLAPNIVPPLQGTRSNAHSPIAGTASRKRPEPGTRRRRVRYA